MQLGKFATTTSKLEHQPLKRLTTSLFPVVKIIADVPGWGCGGSF